MHACECVWCRDCSRLVAVDAPHNCEDAALEELAGARKWMRCPKPSKLLLFVLLLQVGQMFVLQVVGLWLKRTPDATILPVGVECKSLR